MPARGVGVGVGGRQLRGTPARDWSTACEDVGTDTKEGTMATKITFIYDNPADADAFESAYADGHVALARSLPGARRVESAKVWPKEDGSPTPAYRTLDVYFDDYDAACASIGSVEGQKLVPQVFSMATGGVRILVSEIEA